MGEMKQHSEYNWFHRLCLDMCSSDPEWGWDMVGAMSCSQWCFVQIPVHHTNNHSSWARNNWSFRTRKLLHWIHRFSPSFYNRTCYCLTGCVHTWKFPAHPIKRTCMLWFNARSHRMNAAIWIRCLVSNPRVQTSGSRFRFSLDWLN